MSKLDSKSFVFFKGSIFHLLADPAVDSNNCFEFLADGLLVVKDGLVLEVGDFSELSEKYEVIDVHDYTGKIICPGFIDTHVHYPQIFKTASYGDQLLPWLENYIFPEERKFADLAYAEKVADVFIRKLLRNGTTTALVFPTVHAVSVNAFFEICLEKKLRMICGKVLMDRNVPEDLRDDPESSYKKSKELIERWHKKDRLLYAITPRFAPTCSEEQLTVVKKLQEEFPDVYIHTHLAENKAEIEWVKELFPDSKNYLDVYDSFGLVGSKSVFAHCLHLDESEFQLFSEKKAAMSFCPSSNAFLGSGFFKLHEAEKHNIKVGMGTDLGAGTSFSMLETLGDAYKMIKLQKSFTENPDEIKALDPLKAFYLATLGGAKALSLDDKIGNFEVGKEADIVILNPNSDSFMKARCKDASLGELLFVLMMMGKEQNIERTYIMGELCTC
jgi:guanine deaminase